MKPFFISSVVFTSTIGLVLLSFDYYYVAGDYCFGNDTICGSGGYQKEITLLDMQNFCLFLPRKGSNMTVQDSEGCCDSSWCTRHSMPGGCVQPKDAIAYCSKENLTMGAGKFIDGMFKSAHLVRDATNGRIQITGQYDISLLASHLQIQPNDDGGQYDFTGTNQYRVNSPPSGKPVGNNLIGGQYIEYLQQVGNGEFCLQLCSQPYACNSDNDWTGCRVAIPGDYDSPGFTEAEGLIYRQNSPAATGKLPPTQVPVPLTSGLRNVASPGSQATLYATAAPTPVPATIKGTVFPIPAAATIKGTVAHTPAAATIKGTVATLPAAATIKSTAAPNPAAINATAAATIHATAAPKPVPATIKGTVVSTPAAAATFKGIVAPMPAAATIKGTTAPNPATINATVAATIKGTVATIPAAATIKGTTAPNSATINATAAATIHATRAAPSVAVATIKSSIAPSSQSVLP